MRHLTAALTTALVLVLSGCDSASAPAETPVPTSSSAARTRQGGPPTGSAASSLWALIDGKGETIRQLPDDDPDVTAVRTLVALHSATTDNRDDATITVSAEREFDFYAPGFAQSLRGQSYDRRLVALYRTNKLATRQVKTAWYRSTLYEDRATAKAEMDTVLQFTAADPGYLEKGGFVLDTPYTQHRTVSLAKQDGQWKITAIRKSPMTKAAQRPASS
ncbi:hypothetical protein [Streptomyces sp. NRRL WC-3549]|uniref:hypothetical protein n=1 Tax=Streptomyces sp. NRRL WC-3549 TaxID=1463925 RepID=UPI0004CAB33A|nr:hypothetical protein [Streptomyces sp. NRRL WC-3549]